AHHRNLHTFPTRRSSDLYYYTNPMNREDDSIATGVNKDILSSQLRVTYMNQFGQSSMINSYTDSIVHEQISFELIDDGIRVNYRSEEHTSELQSRFDLVC